MVSPLLLSALFFCLAAEPMAWGKQHHPNHHWYQRNKNTIQSIYNLTIFPANAKIIQGGGAAVPKGLFNKNSTGRVTPVGQFVGFEDSIEYFFGLAPLPTGQAPNGVISNATLVEFTSGCPEVAASVVYLTISTLNSDNSFGPFLTALKEIAFWHFDDHGAVLKYDAWIPGLDRFIEVSKGFDFYSPAGTNITIHQICEAQALACTGGNKQYSNVEECVSVLQNKPFGRLDEAWGDNVACRSIHVLLTSIRPEVHCPHVGPTGGGKCIDVAYNDVFFNDQSLFGKPLGQPFNCPKDYWE
ncbi:hypothetical protein C8J57DRAFT_1726200 [Mycena rebaudengoi]|nr:hypothetical protein C8J57DRAFT_1726200 [Mycena rebaudengoi]